MLASRFARQATELAGSRLQARPGLPARRLQVRDRGAAAAPGTVASATRHQPRGAPAAPWDGETCQGRSSAETRAVARMTPSPLPHPSHEQRPGHRRRCRTRAAILHDYYLPLRHHLVARRTTSRPTRSNSGAHCSRRPRRDTGGGPPSPLLCSVSPPFPSDPGCCSLLPTRRQETMCHATRSVPCCPSLYIQNTYAQQVLYALPMCEIIVAGIALKLRTL
jgi:hypothetical protein